MRTIIYDTRLSKQIKPLLDVDTLVVQRLPAATDAEGNPSGNRTTVASVNKGTITSASEMEQQVAAQRGTQVDKVLVTEIGLDIQGGDFVTVNGGTTFEVIDVVGRRLYQRCALRIVT